MLKMCCLGDQPTTDSPSCFYFFFKYFILYSLFDVQNKHFCGIASKPTYRKDTYMSPIAIRSGRQLLPSLD